MILIKATAWSWSVCLLYVLFVGRVPFMNDTDLQIYNVYCVCIMCWWTWLSSDDLNQGHCLVMVCMFSLLEGFLS